MVVGGRRRVCLVGVVKRKYNRFPHITYPYSSCICSFLQLRFVHFLNVFRIIIIYVVYIYYFV